MEKEQPEKTDPEFIEISCDRPQKERPQPSSPRRLIEVMLDPRTLQGLMLVGGGLLVLGLVAWLWSIGVFENRLVVASCLGAANVALLVTGVAGFHFTRYQTAAKGITLLGCLVMPLNLWFYDAQGLITLDQGGHLWIPALVCCAVYVLVARLLADPLFVHVIVGGIAMTGMLFLADRQVGRFWEIIAPSSFLVVFGMICIHLERAFAAGKGPFSRERFGQEFFRAGHVLMSIGLAVLFVGRLRGLLYGPYLTDLGLMKMPAVATEIKLQWITLALVLGGAYSYVYSQLVVRPQGRYLASAALAILWSSFILLDVLAIPFTLATLTLAMAVPLGIAGISVVSRSETTQRACAQAAQLATILVLLVGVGMTLGFVNTTMVGQPHLWCAVLFAEAAICFGLANVRVTGVTSSVLSALSICAATWQLFLHLNVTQHVFLLALATVGIACLVAAEFFTRRRKEVSKFATASLWAGRICVSLGGVATILMSLARVLVSETHGALIGLLAAQVVASVVAATLSRESGWRRHFFVLTVVEALLALLIINSLSSLGMLQRMELLITFIGLLTVAAGYLGWYREDEETKQELVSFNLAIGSLLSAVPLTLGLIALRFSISRADWGWVLLHEVGALTVGMVLLGAGVLCRIRWSTLVGSCTLTLYVVSLVGLVRLPDQLQTTAITMMVGGGLFFGSAVLLSIYRDRLLALPQRVQEGEGVFRVFKWR